MSDTSSDDDDTGISPLQGESNFYVWKSHIKWHLEHADLWNIMSGVTPRPAALDSMHTPAQELWDRSSFVAHDFLNRHISPEVHRYHHHHETPQALWKSLVQQYHRHDARALLKSFNDISSLRFSDTSTESFSDYLITFDHHWSDLCFRTEDADQPRDGVSDSLETALRVLVNSDESKREFLLASIPASMGLFVVNLKDRVRSDLNYPRLRSELRLYHASVREYDLEEMEDLDFT